jgi:hypothetical protein
LPRDLNRDDVGGAVAGSGFDPADVASRRTGGLDPKS